VRKRGGAAEERAEHVHLEHLPPAIRHLFPREAAVTGRPRVVDQKASAVRARARRSRSTLDGAGVGDVQRERSRTDLLRHLCDLRPGARGDRHVVAGLSETRCDGSPDAPARAGHECDSRGASSSADRINGRALELDQEALGLESAAVAGQRPVRADHAVARDDDRDGVRAICSAGGADRGGPADAGGELGVRDRLAVPDALQLGPDRAAGMACRMATGRSNARRSRAKYSSSWRRTAENAPSSRAMPAGGPCTSTGM